MNALIKQLKRLSLLPVVFFLGACSSDVELTAKFSSEKSITKGDSVLFLKQEIGQVEKVKIVDGMTIVDFSIAKESIESNNLHSNLGAGILSTPPALELYLGQEGKPLESGLEVKALNNPLEVAAWSAEGAMNSLSDLLSSTAGSIGDFLNSQDFSDVENQVTDLLSMFSKKSTESVEQLNTGLEEMFNTFNQQSENTLNQANELNKSLNQGIQKLQNEGQQELADILNQLQQSLQATVDNIEPKVAPDVNRDSNSNLESDAMDEGQSNQNKSLNKSEAF